MDELGLSEPECDAVLLGTRLCVFWTCCNWGLIYANGDSDEDAADQCSCSPCVCADDEAWNAKYRVVFYDPEEVKKEEEGGAGEEEANYDPHEWMHPFLARCI